MDAIYELDPPMFKIDKLKLNDNIQTLSSDFVEAQLYDIPVSVYKARQFDINPRNLPSIASVIHDLTYHRHPNILLFMGFSTDATNNLYLAMESLSQGSLRSVLSHKKHSKLNWDDHLLDIAISICKAMTYLHGRDHVHKDLTSSSIFVGSDYGSTKVGWRDVFGFERARGKPQASDAYVAPEVLGGHSNYDKRSDVYSFGIVLWEMISGESPERIYVEYQETLRRNYSFTNNEFVLEYPSEDISIPEYVEDLFEDCTNGNPHLRPTFEDILLTLENEKLKLRS